MDFDNFFQLINEQTGASVDEISNFLISAVYAVFDLDEHDVSIETNKKVEPSNLANTSHKNNFEIIYKNQTYKIYYDLTYFKEAQPNIKDTVMNDDMEDLQNGYNAMERQPLTVDMLKRPNIQIKHQIFIRVKDVEFSNNKKWFDDKWSYVAKFYSFKSVGDVLQHAKQLIDNYSDENGGRGFPDDGGGSPKPSNTRLVNV